MADKKEKPDRTQSPAPDPNDRGSSPSGSPAPESDSKGDDNSSETASHAAETSSSPTPEFEASTAENQAPAEGLGDKWWVWVLGGLAIAAFFGLLHVLT